MELLGSVTAIGPGEYPLKLVCSSPTTPPKEYSFKLTITPAINRLAKYKGYYVTSGPCNTTNYNGITLDTLSPNIVRMAGERSASPIRDTLYVTIDCCSNNFTIPRQRFASDTLEGLGYIMDNGDIWITKKITPPSGPSYSCQVRMIRW